MSNETHRALQSVKRDYSKELKGDSPKASILLRETYSDAVSAVAPSELAYRDLPTKCQKRPAQCQKETRRRPLC